MSDSLVKDRNGRRLKVGDAVRIREPGAPHGIIRAFLDDVAGGVVLDRETEGMRYWNGPEDLTKIINA